MQLPTLAAHPKCGAVQVFHHHYVAPAWCISHQHHKLNSLKMQTLKYWLPLSLQDSTILIHWAIYAINYIHIIGWNKANFIYVDNGILCFIPSSTSSFKLSERILMSAYTCTSKFASADNTKFASSHFYLLLLTFRCRNGCSRLLNWIVCDII